jgi:hypothetical protein
MKGGSNANSPAFGVGLKEMQIIRRQTQMNADNWGKPL